MADLGNFLSGFTQSFAAARARKEQKEMADKELKARTQLFELQLKKAQQEQTQQDQQASAQQDLSGLMTGMSPLKASPGTQVLDPRGPMSLAELLADPEGAQLLLRSGTMTGKDILAAQAGPQETDAIRTLRALQADPSLLKTELERRKAGATNVSLGDQGLTPPPSGFYRPDPKKPGLVIEPGGPAAASAAEASAKAEGSARQIIEKADTVIGTVQDALQLATPLNTGFTGKQFSNYEGTPAYNLKQKLETIKANIAFDTLSQMRAASPTGGALGSTSERELTALQSSLGALDQFQDSKELAKNLNAVLTHYDNWKRTVQSAPAGAISEVGATGQTSLPAGIPPGSVQIGTSGGKPVYQTPDGKRLIVE